MKFCTERHRVTIFGSKNEFGTCTLPSVWYPGLTFCLMRNSQVAAMYPVLLPCSSLGDEGAEAAVLINAVLWCGDGYNGAIK